MALFLDVDGEYYKLKFAENAVLLNPEALPNHADVLLQAGRDYRIVGTKYDAGESKVLMRVTGVRYEIRKGILVRKIEYYRKPSGH